MNPAPSLRQSQARPGAPRHEPTLVAAGVILLLILCLGPLPFGAVLTRDRVALQVAVFVALAVVLLHPRRWDLLRPASRPALLVAAVGVVGVLQSLAWPAGLVSLLAPRAMETWASARQMLGEAAAAIPLSLAPSVSREVALQWLAVAACGAVAAAAGSDRRVRRLLLGALLALAIFEIVYGASNWFQRRSTIWGIEVPGETARLRGTFINANHLAFFLVGPLACSFAWLWWSLRRAFQDRALEQRLLLVTLPGMVFAMLFVGVAFTGSRAGMLAVAVTLCAQSLFLSLHYRDWRVGLLGLGALLLGAGGILAFGLQQGSNVAQGLGGPAGQAGLDRWLQTSPYAVTWNSRFTIYGKCLELWREFPWTGTGLGTFRQAFPLVQGSEVEPRAWEHAHNDFLEMLVTTGILGLPILALVLWILGRRMWNVVQRGRRSEDRAAGLAGLGALAGLGVHSLLDFGITLPANAFTLAILCGAVLGTATYTPRPSPPPDARVGKPS